MTVKKILFVQFRKKELVEHEFDCVKNKIKSRNIKLEIYNAFTKAPPLNILEKYDALIFGGCGEFFVSKNNYLSLKEKGIVN